jgi:hypothetical protein
MQRNMQSIPDNSLVDAPQTQRALEAGFRAILTLFAAVVGYGLKHILDFNAGGDAPEGLRQLAQFRWPLFIVAIATFARFVVGAAIHITYEHIRLGNKAFRLTYLLDILFVSVYGLISRCVLCANTDGCAWLAFGIARYGGYLGRDGH